MKKSLVMKKSLRTETIVRRFKEKSGYTSDKIDDLLKKVRADMPKEVVDDNDTIYGLERANGFYLLSIAREMDIDLYEDEEKIETISKSAIKVFDELKKRGYKPYLEYSLPISSAYRIDVALSKQMVAIEIDGPHHDSEEQKKKDAYKEKLMKEYGWKVIRFKSKEAYNNTNEVVDKIIEFINF